MKMLLRDTRLLSANSRRRERKRKIASANKNIADWGMSAYQFLMPICLVVFAVCLLILLPLTFVGRTRYFAATSLLIASYLFGLTLWVACCAMTFSYFGWFGLIIGLVFAGVGVFPLALWAAFVGVGQASVGLLFIGMFVVAIGTRIFAMTKIGQAVR
jgi:hypothetical protein